MVYFINDLIHAALHRMHKTLAARQAKVAAEEIPSALKTLKTAEAIKTVTIATEELEWMKERISALSSEAAHWRSEHRGLVRRFTTATFACHAIKRETETDQHHIVRQLEDSRANCHYLRQCLDNSAVERHELHQMIEKKRDLVNTAVDCAMTLEVMRIEVEEENERLAVTIRRMKNEHAKALEKKKREYRRLCTQLDDLCSSWVHYAEFLERDTAAAEVPTAPAKTEENSTKEATQKSAGSRLRLPTPINQSLLRKPATTEGSHRSSSSSSNNNSNNNSISASAKNASLHGPSVCT